MNIIPFIIFHAVFFLIDCSLIEKATRFGHLHGFRVTVEDSEAEVYPSVPFAEPPLGSLRLENPKPLTEDDERVVNITQSNPCIQSFEFSGFDSYNRQSEDCLYMKVIVPVKKQNDSKYPAVIWIHGGSYSVGSNDVYPDDNIVRHFISKGIAFIAPNYRLGALGFLSTGEADFPGNYGLEDVLCAVEMVKSLANDFHLDISQLTIGGESAGAALASMLSISPRAQNMFSSTILISGSSQNIWAIRESMTISSTKGCAAFCGCTTLYAHEMKECLKTKDVNCFIQYQKKRLYMNDDTWMELMRMGSTRLTPIIDSYKGNASILPDKPSVLIAKYGRGPILASVTTDEGNHRHILNNLILITCGSETFCNPGSLRTQITSIISSEPLYTKILAPLMFEKYFPTPLTLSNNSTRMQLSNMLTRDMTSSVYHEALLYSLQNVSVYTLENEVHLTEPTVHGHDSSCLFGSDFFHSGCDNCHKQEQFALKYAEILTTFIKKKQISHFQPFTSLNRIAHKLNANGTTLIDWHTEDYYFWWQTVAMFENVLTKMRNGLVNEHGLTT